MGAVTQEGSFLTFCIDAIEAAARDEIDHEIFRSLVEERKQKIREYDSAARWWHRLFPWVITIERRDNV